MFFHQLQKEMERDYREAVSFQPTHVLDEQPKLIKAGQMKDYQVSTPCTRLDGKIQPYPLA